MRLRGISSRGRGLPTSLANLQVAFGPIAALSDQVGTYVSRIDAYIPWVRSARRNSTP
jgi:hypothetical protein